MFKVLCLSMLRFINLYSQLEHKQNYLIVWGETSQPDMLNKHTKFPFYALFIFSWHQNKEKRKTLTFQTLSVGKLWGFP